MGEGNVENTSESSDTTFEKRLVELQSLFELSKTLNSSLQFKNYS